jgi:hypothetical protein
MEARQLGFIIIGSLIIWLAIVYIYFLFKKK